MKEKIYASSYIFILRWLAEGDNYRPHPTKLKKWQHWRIDPVHEILKAKGNALHSQEMEEWYAKEHREFKPLWMEVMDCDSRMDWFLNNMLKYGLIEKQTITVKGWTSEGFVMTEHGRHVHSTQGNF